MTKPTRNLTKSHTMLNFCSTKFPDNCVAQSKNTHTKKKTLTEHHNRTQSLLTFQFHDPSRQTIQRHKNQDFFPPFLNTQVLSHSIYHQATTPKYKMTMLSSSQTLCLTLSVLTQFYHADSVPKLQSHSYRRRNSQWRKKKAL